MEEDIQLMSTTGVDQGTSHLNNSTQDSAPKVSDEEDEVDEGGGVVDVDKGVAEFIAMEQELNAGECHASSSD